MSTALTYNFTNALFIWQLHDEKYSTYKNTKERISGSTKISDYESSFEIHIKKEDEFYEEIIEHICNMPFSKRWEEEGIAKPNVSAKNKTKKICHFLYNKYALKPSSVLPTKEEGVAIFYERSENKYSLNIEIYNDLDISGLVNDDRNKKIILSENINNFNFGNLVKALCS